MRDNVGLPRIAPVLLPAFRTMTDRYAVIGNPIGHSKSPLIHGAFAQATGQDIQYTAIEGPLDGFRATVEAFIADGGKGMNVTIPFKLQAFDIGAQQQVPARKRIGRCYGFHGHGGRKAT